MGYNIKPQYILLTKHKIIKMHKNKVLSEESDEPDDDSDDEKIKLDAYRPKIDRILKDSNINFKKIIINVSLTQYPVVTEVAEELNWKVQTDKEAGDWDIFWTDYSIEPDILIRMHLHQKINYYPGIYVIARKNLLGFNLMTMRNKFPQEYNFFPLTWMLPSQYSQFRMYYQSIQKGKVRTYIVKPEAECQGRGIFLTRNIQDLQNGSHYVIQRYITKPYLIDGLKFDFRIYVLLAGTEPLRVYLYEQGLVRFATQSYVQPNPTNLNENFIHLTNYAINKLNPKFVFNKGVNDMSSGHKRSLTSVYKLLEKKGENVTELKAKIKDIIIKTLITSNPLISHQYRYSQPQQYSGNMCFHILGFDILLTQACQPILLEVNHTPSFTTDTPLDKFIKHSLIKDTLTIMNINLKTKNTLFKRAKILNSDRLLTGKRQIYQGEIKQKQIEKAQSQRDEYENSCLGRFQKIHPVTNVQRQNKYKQFYQFATKNYLQENTLKAKIEERQAKKMLKQERMMLKQKEGFNKIEKQQLSQKSEKSEKTPCIKSERHTAKIEKTSQMIQNNQHHKNKIGKSSASENRTNNSQVFKSKECKNQNAQEKNKQKYLTREMNLHEMIRLTKESIRQINNNNDNNKHVSLYQKYAKTKVQLPHLPQQQQQIFNQVKKDTNQLFRKHHAVQIRAKMSKIKKTQEQPYAHLRNCSIKNGNFIMPKIFDINVDEKYYQPFTVIKLNPINKYSSDQ